MKKSRRDLARWPGRRVCVGACHDVRLCSDGHNHDKHVAAPQKPCATAHSSQHGHPPRPRSRRRHPSTCAQAGRCTRPDWARCPTESQPPRVPPPDTTGIPTPFPKFVNQRTRPATLRSQRDEISTGSVGKNGPL